MIGSSSYDAPIRYVPAVYWRQSEMLALEGIEKDVPDVAPLITLKRPGFIDPPDTGGEGPSDFDGPRLADAADLPVDSYVRKVADQIADIAFGKGRLVAAVPLPFVYCDTSEVDDAAGRTMMPQLLERADSPVVPVWRTRTPKTRLNAMLPWADDGRGIAVRAVLGDLLNGFKGIPEAVRSRASQTDVIFDYGYIDRSQTFPPASPSWFERLTDLTKAYPWRRVVLLAGSFRPSLTRYSRFMEPRLCRDMQDAFARQHDGPKVIRGDYTCVHPELIDSPHGSHNPNVRYAFDDVWVIYRERPVPAPLPSPYRAIYRACTGDPTFKSNKFSVGDFAMHDVAAFDREPGWAKASLARGISHHIRTATLEARSSRF